MSVTNSIDNLVAAIAIDAGLDDKAHFSQTPSRTIDLRFDVYRNSYNATLNRAISQIYPVIRLIVGESCFNLMAQDFINLYPSFSVNLNNYGKQFSVFIKQQLGSLQAFAELPYLSDLASLEYAWHEAYFAADEEAFPFDLFSTKFDQLDSLVLTLNPSLHHFVSNYPVIDIWQSHRQGVKAESIQQLETEYYICIVRINEHISVSTIAAEIFQFLDYCQQGKTLAFIAEQSPASIQQMTFAIEQRYISGFTSTLVHNHD